LREQLPKYLGADVELKTTKCVLSELERLGSQLYGALVICRQFPLAQCPHVHARAAAECLLRLAKKGRSVGHPKYIIATQVNPLALRSDLILIRI
jgi:U3 small nucleolar RNA-associated protein 23